jgi:putative PEP-CTERM system TPR-repeat lipoprotein
MSCGIERRIIQRIRCAVLGLLIALAACDGGASETEYIRRAHAHKQAGDFAAAVIELKNALQQNPDSADAHLLLGEAFLEIGNPAGAVKQLSRARDLGRNTDQLRFMLAEARLRTGDYAALLDDLPSDSPLDEPAAVNLYVIRGEALFALGRIKEAKEVFGRALAANPVAAAYACLARVALLESDLGEAERLVGEGLAASPNNISLVMLNGERLMAQRRFAEAEAAFVQAEKINPNDLVARLGVVRAQIGQGKLLDAKAGIEQLLAEAPRNPTILLLQGVVALQSNDYGTAQRSAQQVLSVDENNLAAMFVAGAASFALEQLEHANRLLTRYVAEVPKDTMARRLLAATQLRLGQAGAAFRTLTAAPETADTDAESLALMSAAAIISGNAEAGVQYLERAVVQSPEDAALRSRLGLMRIAAGDPTQGALDLAEALKLDPRLEDDPGFERAEAALFLAYLREQKFDEALAQARRWQARHPESTTGHTMAGIAHLGRGEDSEARAAFNKALELMPGAPDASMNLAVLELRQGRLSEAETLLKKAVEANPKHVRLLVMLAELAQRQGRIDEAKNRLEQAVAAEPDASAPRVFLARFYLQANEPSKALDLAETLAAAYPQEPSVLEVFGRTQLALGQTAEAAGTFEQLAALVPPSAQPHYLLAHAYDQLGQPAKVQAELEAALKIDANHAESRFALARLLLSANDPAAKPHIDRLAQNFPAQPEVKELQGELALRNNDPSGALRLFREARQQLDIGRLAVAEARAQWVTGDRDGSLKILEACTWCDLSVNT